MSRLATSFVLGYHGCDQSTAAHVISGKRDLAPSDNEYDWLGPGIYFWESDPRRALEWANRKVKRGEFKKAAVVGAVIDLGECLDLATRDGLEELRIAHDSFLQMQQSTGAPIPQNKAAKGEAGQDRLLRYLDCAVVRHLHFLKGLQSKQLVMQEKIPEPSYDTVRGMFVEGSPVYEGAGFRAQSHTQVAVRNHSCILGYFWPKPYPKV